MAFHLTQVIVKFSHIGDLIKSTSITSVFHMQQQSAQPQKSLNQKIDTYRILNSKLISISTTDISADVHVNLK